MVVFNPYFQLPNAIDPDNFYGSIGMVHQLLQRISASNPRAVELLGMPGMGKTNLLRYLRHPDGALKRNTQSLQSPFRENPHRLFLVLVEYRLMPPETHPFQYLYERLCMEYEEYQGLFEAERGSKLPSLEKEDFSDREYGEVGVLAASRITEGIKRLATCEQRIRPVFLLDDFDLAVRKEVISKEGVDKARPWRQYVSLVLAVEKRIVEVNAEVAASAFFQVIPLVRLGGLTEDEARELLTEPVEGFFPREDVNLVMRLAGGHPHLLILAGSALWSVREHLNLLHVPQQPLSDEETPVLQGRLQQDFSRVFDLYWDRQEQQQKEALIASTTSSILAKQHKAVLASLMELDLVAFSPADKAFHPFSPLFAEYVAQKREPSVFTASLDLTQLESDLFEYLSQRPNEIITFEELWKRVWNQEVGEDETQIRRPIQVTVSRLRKKLELTGNDIVSIRDQGYRFVMPA